MADEPDFVDVHVGRVLRARRLVVGQTQTSLGEAMGVSFQQVQKYENGRNRVSASMLYKAALSQGVPTAFYFEGLKQFEVAQSEEADSVTSWLSSKEAWAVGEQVVQLSKSARTALVQFVRDLNKS